MRLFTGCYQSTARSSARGQVPAAADHAGRECALFLLAPLALGVPVDARHGAVQRALPAPWHMDPSSSAQLGAYAWNRLALRMTWEPSDTMNGE